MNLTSATKTSAVKGFSNSLLYKPVFVLAFDHLLFYYIFVLSLKINCVLVLFKCLVYMMSCF